MPSGHLGDLGAALVDDQLTPQARDAALAHLAICPECRCDIEAQQRLKARLRCLDEPSLPLTLAMRLSALKPDAAPVPGGGPPPGGGLAPALTFPVRDHGRVLSARRGRLLVGAASLLLVGMGTGYAAAADVQPGPAGGTPANTLSTSGHAVVTSSVSLTDPAFAAMNATFVP